MPWGLPASGTASDALGPSGDIYRAAAADGLARTRVKECARKRIEGKVPESMPGADEGIGKMPIKCERIVTE